jgi:hypothetical protein
METATLQIISPHQLVRMASRMCEYVGTEPRAFTQATQDRFTGEDAGCGQVVFGTPSLHRVRRQETQGDSPKDVSAGEDDSGDPFADYHNVEPMKFPENCDDIVKQSWYHKGRIDGQKEQFEKLMPVIDGMLDRTIR